MSNDQQGSRDISTGAGAEDKECEVMVVRSKDVVKLTNLETVRPTVKGSNGASYCIDYHCNLRCKGLRLDHELPKLVPTAHLFPQKQVNWMLGGDVCINLQDESSVHLKLKLSVDVKDECVSLMAELERYPKTGNESNCTFGKTVDAVIKSIESFVCTFTLLDKNLKDIGETRCFQFNGNELFYNENFCPQRALMEACQTSPEGANTSLGTSSSFDFVDVKIETTISFKEISQVLMKGSMCSTKAFQMKQSSSKEFPSLKTEGNPERPLKFTEVVILKAGDRSLEKFYVYKDRLMQESPVFAKMFGVTMSEKTTGEVVLTDCTVLVLEAFIGFLYENVTDSQSDDSVDVFLGVLALAHQYDTRRVVQNIKKIIISVRNKSLNLKLALKMYAVGHLYELPDLKFRAVQWIKCNKIQVKTAEGKKQVREFFDCNKDLGSSIFVEAL